MPPMATRRGSSRGSPARRRSTPRHVHRGSTRRLARPHQPLTRRAPGPSGTNTASPSQRCSGSPTRASPGRPCTSFRRTGCSPVSRSRHRYCVTIIRNVRTGPVLRAAVPDDAALLAWGLGEAADGLFATMLGRRAGAILTKVMSQATHEYSFQHAAVAELDGAPAGVCQGFPAGTPVRRGPLDRRGRLGRPSSAVRG